MCKWTDNQTMINYFYQLIVEQNWSQQKWGYNVSGMIDMFLASCDISYWFHVMWRMISQAK